MFQRGAASESKLTETQRTCADGVRTLLKRLRVVHAERIETTNAEAWYCFEIKTSPESGLRVTIAVVGDVFVFQANGAELRRDLESWWSDPSGWVAECLRVLQELLQTDLRIRLRRTLFGSTTGAVWVSNRDGDGGWSGDLVACRGRGREYSYPATWYLEEASSH